MDEIALFKQWVEESNNIVFFGGAGVSTESGIKDFRSVDGLYHEKYDYPPETMLSHSFFMQNPAEFFKFHKDKILVEGIKPNITHLKLAELEQKGKLKAIVTQNIDGLHTAAGSKEVYEIHGSALRNYCMDCGKEFPGIRYVKDAPGIPRCDKCGGIVRPDVVLYEESLDYELMKKSKQAISNADMLIVAGTSLVVYPAAGMIDYYNGNKLVLINLQATSYDARANLVIRRKIGEVFSQI